MADKKVLFIAFAIEDERQRDFLKGQSLHPRQPFEFIDMSVKEPYDKDWKDRVRTRIKRSDGVIVLVSKNSAASTGQKWEISCAKEEKKPIRGIYAYKDDRSSIDGVAFQHGLHRMRIVDASAEVADLLVMVDADD
jgi:hypothetical protein